MRKYNLIKHIFLTIFSVLIFQYSFSQAQLVIKDNAYMVIENDAFLVLDNPAPSALSVTGTGGNIKSESENNRIRWNIKNSTGTYTIPFAKGNAINGHKIPYTIEIGTAGVGLGHYDFSTYGGSTWDNATYMPSMVTHMDVYNSPNTTNYSAQVIDRFWLINPQGYSTKPVASTMTFTYIDAEREAAGNILPADQMGAQRFNNVLNSWSDMASTGSVNVAAKTVTTQSIASEDFYAAWTLSEKYIPELDTSIQFSADCEDPGIEIKWTTASETNVDYFLIEKATELIDWTFVAQVPSQGNSLTPTFYQYLDLEKLPGDIYYRLTKVDSNGVMEIIGADTTNCGIIPDEPIIIEFSADCEREGVITKWTKTTDLNVDSFFIEKSTDNENWTIVTQGPGQGNTYESAHYYHWDDERLPGNTYYRLTYILLSGDTVVYGPATANCDFDDITIMPNPNFGDFTVRIESNQQVNGMIMTMHDARGRLIYKNSVNVEEGINNFRINDRNINSGAYFLKLIYPDADPKIFRIIVVSTN